MTIASYTDLQSAIADWTVRTDVSNIRILDFITLFEAKVMRRLRVRQMEETLDVAFQPNGAAWLNTIPMPSDWIANRRVKLIMSDGTTPTVRYVTPDVSATAYSTIETGTPKVFTILNSYFEFAPIPDSSYTVEFDYYGFTGLSNVAPSNWLLATYPDMYLWGSIAELGPYCQDPEIITYAESTRDKLFDEIVTADRTSTFSGSPLVMQVLNGCP